MDSVLAKEFGRQLKAALKSERLSQIELARKLRVSGSAVSQMVNGKLAPSAECFDELLTLLADTPSRDKLIRKWRKLRVGKFADAVSEVSNFPVVADGYGSLFALPDFALAEYDGEVPLRAFAADRNYPLVNCPDAAPEAQLTVTFAAADLALPMAGEVELYLGEPESAGATGLDLIYTGKGFMLNPGSVTPLPKKIRRKFPVWELRLRPQFKPAK